MHRAVPSVEKPTNRLTVNRRTDQDMAKTKTIKITQTKSAIDSPKRQRRTLEALGIRGMHKSVEIDDTPAMRGMLDKVRHLVDISEA